MTVKELNMQLYIHVYMRKTYHNVSIFVDKFENFFQAPKATFQASVGRNISSKPSNDKHNITFTS